MKVRIVVLSSFVFIAALVSNAQLPDVTPGPAGNQSKAAMPPATKSAPASTPGTPQLQNRNPRYQIRPGDTFDVLFPFTPEFNQAVAVQPDGFVSLREVGDVFVQDKTVAEVTQLVRTSYSHILRNPEVAIVLKDFEKPHFVVGGEVEKPGKYDLRSDTTATEALAIAGGLNKRAKHSEVLLFRRVSQDWVEVKVIDVKKLYASANMREDIHLRPGDMLYVPQNQISKITPFLPVWSLSTYMNPIH